MAEKQDEGSLGRKKSVQEYAQEYQQSADSQLPLCLGFSARLNMLWDLAGAAPAQTEGRVLGVMGINSGWRESDVRNWLQKDVLPPRLDLHNMVRFLVAQLDGDEYVINGQKSSWVSNGSFASHAALWLTLDPSQGMGAGGIANRPR